MYEREQVARGRAEGLEPLIPRFFFDMPEKLAQLPGFAVLVDGVRVEPKKLFGGHQLVDAGVHEVQVLARGKKPWRRTFEAKPSETIAIHLERLPPVQ
jgi:hypothetical protein